MGQVRLTHWQKKQKQKKTSEVSELLETSQWWPICGDTGNKDIKLLLITMRTSNKVIPVEPESTQVN